MLGTLSFEPAASTDAEQLVALRIVAMRESLASIGRFDPRRVRERFLDTFDPALTRHILLNAQRVGFVVTRPQADYLFLNHLYVLPGFQGRGIGAWVLQSVFSEADVQGLPVKVGALRGSDSNRFYLRHGFVLTHEEEFDLYYWRDTTAPVVEA